MTTGWMAILAGGVMLMWSGGWSVTAKQQSAKAIENAYYASPKDPAFRSAYAAIAPCSLSIALYTALATGTKTPDSLRADAYRQLGDYSFVHSAFKTAADRYRQAAVHFPADEYRYLQAKALFALADTSVNSVLRTLLASGTKEYVHRARYLQAMLFIKNELYDSAYAALLFTDSITSGDTYFGEAISAKLECALRLGKNNEVRQLQQTMEKAGVAVLERDHLHRLGVAARGGIPQSQPMRTKQKIFDEKVTYTLQVGAFSSRDNAAALRKKLETMFKNISIVPVTVAESKIYRVRIGQFKSRYDADRFGNDSLAAAGINFRTVVK